MSLKVVEWLSGPTCGWQGACFYYTPQGIRSEYINKQCLLLLGYTISTVNRCLVYDSNIHPANYHVGPGVYEPATSIVEFRLSLHSLTTRNHHYASIQKSHWHHLISKLSNFKPFNQILIIIFLFLKQFSQLKLKEFRFTIISFN